MKTRSEAKREREFKTSREKLREWTIDTPNDPINEQVILAAMIADSDTRKRLAKMWPPEAFYAEQHRMIFTGLIELNRRKLEYDPAVMVRIVPDIDIRILETLASSRPDLPENLDFHIETLGWDWQRARATSGPLAALIDSIQDPKESKEKLKALARAVGDSFEGAGGTGRFLRDPKEVVRQAMNTLKQRVEGEAYYPYGIDGLDYYEDGRRRIRPGASPGTISMITALSGSGKALALDTPIATIDGWTTMGEVTPGMVIFDDKGEPTTVVACTGDMRNRDCYEIEFSDGAKIVADAQHLWKTISFRERYMTMMRGDRWRTASNERRRNVKGAKVRRTQVSEALLRHYAANREEVFADGSIRTTRQIAETLMNGKHRNHAVIVAEPLVCAPKNLPLDPYLLGVWLGDGHTASARVTSADPEVLTYFEICGFKVLKKKRYLWSILGMAECLREVNVLDNKHIPQIYLRASIEQRLALLQGLMDTDGTVSKEGNLSFDNTNPRLVEGFEELIASLGIKAKAWPRQAKINGRVVGTSWRFSFCTDLPVFRLKRKLARTVAPQRGVHRKRFIVAAKKVPSVPVRCIEVDSPNKMFLAGREMIPTHNSTLTGHAILGSARQNHGKNKVKRKVLCGAWEEEAPVTIELLATLSMGLSRSRILDGRSNRLRDDSRTEYEPLSHEDLVAIEECMHGISKHVRFFDNPFQRGRSRGAREVTNDDHLDIIQEHIEDSGCDIFFADLFARCLVDDSPSAERHALFRLLSITQEQTMHTVIVHQQRAKDIETRIDKRPTREGIIGSGAWLDVCNTVMAPHLPAKWKRVPDNTMELYILKQRNGPWPIAIEFDWVPDTGQISNGRSMSVEAKGETDELGSTGMKTPKRGKGQR